MKIISLNAWAGCVYEPLMQFLAEQAITTDIFCFQEMTLYPHADSPSLKLDDEEYGHIRTDLFGDISRALPEFQGIAYPALIGSKFEGGALPAGMEVGQAVFVRRGIDVDDSGGLRCFGADSDIAREKVISITGNCQWIQVDNLVVMNLHGLWQKEGKGDTPDRLQQSEILIEFIASQQLPVVLIGDYNMLPDCQSFAKLAVNKQDLIRDNYIVTTRSSLYTKGIPFSDYALCSQTIEVTDFQLPELVISDHLPLILSFNQK